MAHAHDAAVVARLAKYGYGKNTKVVISETHNPDEFQRRLKPRTWSIFVKALFGRVTIMVVNGENIVVDGQHRLEHAERHGEKTAPAVMFENGTMEDAAAMFDLFNSERIALSAAVAFRAACLSGDRAMLALDKALLARELDGWCNGREAYDLDSIGSVVMIHDQLGLDHTLYTLDVLADCWSWDVPKSPHVRCIRGFAQFLRPQKRVTLRSGRLQERYWDPADRDLLTAYLRLFFPPDAEGTGLHNFLGLAQQKSLGGGGGGGSLGMERVLADALRKARRAE